MTKRAAVVMMLLPALTGCVSAQPVSNPPSTLSDAPPNEVSVTERSGVLQLSLGPANQLLPLTHWDGDTFTFALADENAPTGTTSRAVFNGATLNLEYFDSEKLGTFTR